MLKDTPPRELVEAVHRVAGGDTILSQAALAHLIDAVAKPAPPGTQPETGHVLNELTDRERSVARAVAQGLSNAQIAEQLSISVTTVKTTSGGSWKSWKSATGCRSLASSNAPNRDRRVLINLGLVQGRTVVSVRRAWIGRRSRCRTRLVTAPGSAIRMDGMATSHTDISTSVPRPSYRSTRIGDVERHAACDELSTQFAAGRLTNEELDERLAVAVGARTATDLQCLVADLPPLTKQSSRADSPQAPRTVGWDGWDVLVLLVFLGCLAVAGLASLALLFSGNGGLIIAGTLSSIVAGTGGAAAVHLAHRALHRRRAQAASVSDRR